jgi:hypothetical protein
MGPERSGFWRSTRPANAEYAQHASASAAGVANSDAATASGPNGSNARHEDALGTIPTITNSYNMKMDHGNMDHMHMQNGG